jgi:small conductance mechanosensitive channel
MTTTSLPALAAAQQLTSPRQLAVWDRLISVGGDLITNLLVAALVMAATLWAAGWASKLTRRAFHVHRRHETDETLPIFFSSLARNIVLLLGAIAVLEQLGVKTTSILAAIGAASLAIGLALQGALSNVAAGVMILLFRPYRVGDIVETGGRIGQARSIDLFVTELATLDNLKVVIPNAKVFGDVIINHTFHERRRADTIFRAPPAADVVGLIERLRDWLKTDPRILAEPAPLIEVTSVNEGAVEIAVRPWAATVDYAPVKADLLLCAKLLETDPKTALPRPSTTPSSRTP